MRKTAKLSDEDHKFLKVLAAETGKTVEALLAEAVDLLRKKHQKRKV
jgi:hypothetical protein